MLSLGVASLVVDAGLVPLGALAAAGLGVFFGAAVQLALGTPDGTPPTADVAAALANLGVSATVVGATDESPTWGAARFRARSGDGADLVVDLYGRDAPEGQLLSRLWRFLSVRRSRLELRLRAEDHVEHEVALLLWARELGVGAPTVAAAGRTGRSGDVLLVTRPARGRPLAGLPPEEVPDEVLAAMWRSLEQLHRARLVVGGIGPATVLLGDDGSTSFAEFGRGEAMADPEAVQRDAAALLMATAATVGPRRATGAAREVLGDHRVEELLPLIQPQVLPQHAGRRGGQLKKDLAALRVEAAAQLGVEPVEPVPLVRVQPSKLIMLAATFFGLWLLVEQLVGLSEIGHVLAGASWWLALAVLGVTQLTAFTEALCMTGAAPVPLPLWPLTLLRLAMGFTGMIGGTVATTATVIRFNQRRGLAPGVAVSTGLIYSLSGFVVQIVLTVVALCFAGDQFHLEQAGPSGSGPEILQLALYVVVALGFVAGVVFVVPKIRHAVVHRAAPHVALAWANVRQLFGDPGRLTRLFAGAATTQILMAIGLGLSLRAVGASASLAALLVVCTFTALLGGMAPVPGGMGVMEASYIAGLTLLGVPQDLAIAATLLYRLATTYLPPAWGWVALVWLRRHDQL